MLRDTLSGVSAGICIALGGSVFLAVENRVVGAVLFSVALLCICMKGYALFTGKVGFVPEDRSKPALQLLLAGLLGNLIGTFLCGLVLRLALPAYADGTHTDNFGAYLFSLCIVKGLRESGLPLKDYLLPETPDFNPKDPHPTLQEFSCPVEPRRAPQRPPMPQQGGQTQFGPL